MVSSTDKVDRITRGDKRENPYFLLCRATAQDRNLSFESRGMLAYLLSKPDDWALRVIDLMQHCKRDKVYSILNELLEHRYLTREVIYVKGRIDHWEYKVYELPLPVFPDQVLPDQEKPDSTYKREEQNTELTSLAPNVVANDPLDSDQPREVTQEPTPKRKAPTRDVLYTAVANVLLNLHTSDVIEANAAYVNTLRRILLDMEHIEKPTPDQSMMIADRLRTDFVTWYRQVCPGCNLPGKEKLKKYYGQFLEAKAKVTSQESQPTLFAPIDDYVAPNRGI